MALNFLFQMSINPKAVAQIIYETFVDEFDFNRAEPRVDDIAFAAKLIEMIRQRASARIEYAEETTLYAESDDSESENEVENAASALGPVPSAEYQFSDSVSSEEMPDIAGLRLEDPEYCPTPAKTKGYSKISEEFTLEQMRKISKEYNKHSGNM